MISHERGTSVLGLTNLVSSGFFAQILTNFYLRVLVYLVIYVPEKVCGEPLLLSWYSSQRDVMNESLLSQPTLSLSTRNQHVNFTIVPRRHDHMPLHATLYGGGGAKVGRSPPVFDHRWLVGEASLEGGGDSTNSRSTRERQKRRRKLRRIPPPTCLRSPTPESRNPQNPQSDT